MIYVSKAYRRLIKEPLRALEQKIKNRSADVLGYTIARLCVAWMKARGIRRSTIRDVCGILDAVKYELRKEVSDPYEELMRARHGSPFPDDSDIDSAAWEE